MKQIIINLFIICTQILYINGDCDYNSCPKTYANKLNIHLIAHSHDDVGWMRTVDAYYYFQVRDIITNVVRSLSSKPNRKFTQVETYFFNRWWIEQNDTIRNVTKRLVTSGQLSLANGGWCVNDEGTAFYNNIIDQMSLGLKVLHDLFGECGHPRVSWQIDPFGHSKEMASLYAQMGFDGHVTNRGVRPKGEFIWRANDDLGSSSHIFTTSLHDHYSAPYGFNFESGLNSVTDENKSIKAKQFVKICSERNVAYGASGHVLIPMGDDFQYVNAENWFASMDKLIEEITSSYGEVNVFYSTPSCYVYSVSQLNKTWSERDVDYMNYWVGYYTSRPALKRYDRISNTFLQASKQLAVLANLNTMATKPFLDETRNEEAIMQHHDAITGTSPQITANDYALRLYSGWDASRSVIQNAYQTLLPKSDDRYSAPQVFCDTLNISQCSLTEKSDQFLVTIYNPIARQVSQWIRIPVTDDFYEVFDFNHNNTIVSSFLVSIPKSVTSLPLRNSVSQNEIVFKAELPALGFVTYFVRKNGLNHIKVKQNKLRKKKGTEITEMKGKSFSMQLDDQTGELKSITFGGKSHSIRQSFKYYRSCGGDKDFEDSGSYQFCPNGSAIDFGDSVKLVSKYSSGPLYEVRQQWSDWVWQTIRTYEDEEYIEFDWIVGPIPVDDQTGKEVIIRFESDIINKGLFYTDANGRQMVKRLRDPNATLCTDNNISANWYPIYSKIFIRDENKDLQLTVLTDRTQGGSSLYDGSVEMMVHRRLLFYGEGGDFKIDEPGVDGRGLVIRGKHYLFFKPINESANYFRDLSQRLFLEPIISFAEYNWTTAVDYSEKWRAVYSALVNSLPENVHLLTLENWGPSQLLLRLEHFYETNDNSQLSRPAYVELTNLFKSFKILNITETTLSGTELLADSHRLSWNNRPFSSRDTTERSLSNFTIRLAAQQIRTFVLTVESYIQPEEKCVLSWQYVNQTKSIPNNAIIGGFHTDKSALYVCRFQANRDLIPGKANERIGCHVSDGIEIVKQYDYEILVGKNAMWIPRHGTDPMPRNAFVGGVAYNGQPIYIGRCTVEDSGFVSQVIGKIQYWFYYTYDEIEQTDCVNHQVLVCNS